MTENELKFFEENKERIFDLIRAVDKHENIRLTIGAIQIQYFPHLLPDYGRAHDVMSRLSQHLHGAALLGLNNVGPLDDHSDLPERLQWTPTIIGSC